MTEPAVQAVAWWQAAILGLVQGLGEFLPISSSGHLKLAQHFLGLPSSEGMFAFDVLLHAATLCSLLVYFWADLRQMTLAWLRSVGVLLRTRNWRQALAQPEAKWTWLVLLAMIPTGIFALGLEDVIRPFFDNVWPVSVMLLCAGAFNWFSHRRLQRQPEGRRIEEMRWIDALAVGTVQGLAAVFPGMSRSGSTIAVGLGRGLAGEAAPRFSFLMSVPAVFGAVLVKLPDLLKPSAEGPGPAAMLIGFVIAAVSGYWAVNTVFTTVRRGKFSGFAYYCWTIGGLSLLLLLLGVGR